MVGTFLYGVRMEHGRFEAFETKVTAAGEAQNARAAQRAKDNKNLKKETDNAYKTKADKLRADNAALAKCLQVGAGCGFVRPGQQPVGSKCPDGQVCYDRAEFDAALRGFAADVARQVGQGDALKLKLDTAIEWVAKQRKK